LQPDQIGVLIADGADGEVAAMRPCVSSVARLVIADVERHRAQERTGHAAMIADRIPRHKMMRSCRAIWLHRKRPPPRLFQGVFAVRSTRSAPRGPAAV